MPFNPFRALARSLRVVPSSRRPAAPAVEAVEPRALFAAGPVVTPLPASADAYVRDGEHADANAGLSATLTVKAANASYTRRSYVRFDTYAAAGATSRAVLRLYGRLDDGPADAVSVSVRPVADVTWGETDITWDDRPASGETLVSRSVDQSPRWHEFDVTEYVVRQRQAGQRAVGFAVTADRQADNAVLFNAREASDHEPQLVMTTSGPATAAAPTLAASSPAGLAVNVAPGRVTLPGGAQVDVDGTVLTLAPPQIVTAAYDGPAPANFGGSVLQPAKRWTSDTIGLVPPHDAAVLGGLYRQVHPWSVVVTNGAGRTYVEDVDYKLNREWGQVANLNDRLGDPHTGRVRITYRAALQRLDLIQVRPDGTVAVKRGASVPSVPVLPSPDPGAVALAGVHVATLDGPRSSGYTIRERDIYRIAPAAPVAPINADAIPDTVAKLRAGRAVNVAYFGDSITFGAEAGDWRNSRAKAYTTLVSNGLRDRFPGAAVRETLASEDARSAVDGNGAFRSLVLDPHNAGDRVDLLVIALGMNDLGRPSLDPFRTAMRSYVDRARAAGMEVLLVTPMQSNPFYEPVLTDRVPRSQIAAAIRGLAADMGVACADVYTEWANQASRGVAPVSQLHNGFNHPGASGMRLYADTILRVFDDA